MALARAFTTRRVKQSVDIAVANRNKEANGGNVPQRSKTTKGHPSMRNQISAPVELIHTTNMLSYNAPDINPAKNSIDSSSNSMRSSDEEPESPNTVASTPPTSPEIESTKDLPRPFPGPQPNHLSCYFVAPGTSQPTDMMMPPPTQPVPAIPKRSPSHTKKASMDAAARQRSASTLSRDTDRTVSSKASMTFSSRASSSSTAASTMSHNSIGASQKPPVPAMPPVAFHQSQSWEQQQQQQPKSAETHPFGRELAQVSEIAEEFGIKHTVFDAEEKALKAQGLYKHSAETYLDDVQSLFSTFFVEERTRPQRSQLQSPPPPPPQSQQSQPDTEMWI